MFIQTEGGQMGTSALSAGKFSFLSLMWFITYCLGTTGSGNWPIFSVEAPPPCILILQGMSPFSNAVSYLTLSQKQEPLQHLQRAMYEVKYTYPQLSCPCVKR